MRVITGKDAAVRLFRGRLSTRDDVAERSVREAIEVVRGRGDEGLLELSERFDGVRPARLRVDGDEFARARQVLEPALVDAIRLAARRIEEFYRPQSEAGYRLSDSDGWLGQITRPLDRVGCYVPGGTAPLFSTLLMTAVPARVAGVSEVVAATPPARDGTVHPAILVAAEAAGVSEVYRIGGAQAIAALAFGTESVTRVDKIVGPGNRYVVAAKRTVFGAVGIEALPGPTETLVVADAGAPLGHVVADLLAQAEHAGAVPILVTDSSELIERLPAALEAGLEDLTTADVARASLAERGTAVLVTDLAEAVEVANSFAPEHLCLLVAEPERLLPLVRHAGGVFAGYDSMEALGDYLLGPSHVMPTGGSARFSSFLNLDDFRRRIPVVAAGPRLVASLAGPAALMARSEGLEAHARAIEARLPSQGN